jgi:hypothetical protein
VTASKHIAAGLLGAVLGLSGVSRPGAAAPREPATLPQATVLTNLRSPSGRTVYLILRPGAEMREELRARAGRMAAAAGAALKLHAGPGAPGTDDLWVLRLSHKEQGLDVKRRGRDLTVEPGEPTPVAYAGEAGVRLEAGRPDGDMDLEIMLQARQRLRELEHAPRKLVTLSQGAAARIVLSHLSEGDTLAAYLFGRRYQMLLIGHPDARLIRALVDGSEAALQVELPPGPPGPPEEVGPPDGTPAPAAQEALDRAAAVVGEARALLPEKDRPKDKHEEPRR